MLLYATMVQHVRFAVGPAVDLIESIAHERLPANDALALLLIDRHTGCPSLLLFAVELPATVGAKHLVTSRRDERPLAESAEPCVLAVRWRFVRWFVALAGTRLCDPVPVGVDDR
jgi:hypothetical protein